MMVVYAVTALIAVILGVLVGRILPWPPWLGVIAAAIVMPLALWLGFDQRLSLIAPSCLAVGFVYSRH